MALEELLAEAVQLMVLGMGSVFVLLTVMIGLVNGTSKVLAKLAPEEPPLPSGNTPPKKASDDGELVAVIQAAVHRFRSGS